MKYIKHLKDEACILNCVTFRLLIISWRSRDGGDVITHTWTQFWLFCRCFLNSSFRVQVWCNVPGFKSVWSLWGAATRRLPELQRKTYWWLQKIQKIKILLHQIWIFSFLLVNLAFNWKHYYVSVSDFTSYTTCTHVRNTGHQTSLQKHLILRLSAFRDTVWTLRNAVCKTFFTVLAFLFIQQMLNMKIFLSLCKSICTHGRVVSCCLPRPER